MNLETSSELLPNLRIAGSIFQRLKGVAFVTWKLRFQRESIWFIKILENENSSNPLLDGEHFLNFLWILKII